jgi:hypothetical protein
MSRDNGKSVILAGLGTGTPFENNTMISTVGGTVYKQNIFANNGPRTVAQAPWAASATTAGVDFIDSTKGYILAGEGPNNFYKTTNGGVTWQPTASIWGFRNIPESKHQVRAYGVDTVLIIDRTINANSGIYLVSTNGGFSFGTVPVVGTTIFANANSERWSSSDDIIWLGYKNFSLLTNTKKTAVNNSNTFRIVPNPAGKNSNVLLDFIGQSINSIQLIDATGRLQKTINNLQGSTLSLHGLRPGLYVLMGTTEAGRVVSAKLLVQ